MGGIESDDEPADENDLVLGPPQGRSPAERELRARTYPPVTEDEDPPDTSTQFPIRSLFLLTLAVAIGMSGRNFVSAKVFAGLLAVVANIAIFGHELKLVDDPWVRSLTTWICVACGIAVVIALLA